MFQHFPKYITPASKIVKYIAAIQLTIPSDCRSESNIKFHFREIYASRKIYKSFHSFFILIPYDSCHFMPFKWEKHKMNLLKSLEICPPTLMAAVLLQNNTKQRKCNEKQTKKHIKNKKKIKKTPNLLSFLRLSSYHTQELISDRPKTKSTFLQTGFRFFSSLIFLISLISSLWTLTAFSSCLLSLFSVFPSAKSWYPAWWELKKSLP